MNSAAVDSQASRIDLNLLRKIWQETKKIPPVGATWRLLRREYFRAADLQRRISYIPHHNRIRRQHWNKLQLGAGKNVLPGWLNTDLHPQEGVLPIDATRPLPFADNTFEYVVSEHMIEHISFKEARRMVTEVHRVLRDGGKVRVSTPDFDFFRGLFRDELSAAEEEFISWHIKTYNPGYPVLPLSVMNTMFRSWGHQHLYNEQTLSLLLRQCGFSRIRRYACGESDDRELQGLEAHGRLVGESNNRMETLVLEATKDSSSVSSHF